VFGCSESASVCPTGMVNHSNVLAPEGRERVRRGKREGKKSEEREPAPPLCDVSPRLVLRGGQKKPLKKGKRNVKEKPGRQLLLPHLLTVPRLIYEMKR